MPRGMVRAHPEKFRGEKNGHSRLKEKDILEIIAKYRIGEKVTALALEYSVTRQMITLIVKRKAWKHLKIEETV